MSDCEELVGVTGDEGVCFSQKIQYKSAQIVYSHTTCARGEKCANFVPLAYKNRPYLGKCGNSEESSSY